jgi:hypothetical protein
MAPPNRKVAPMASNARSKLRAGRCPKTARLSMERKIRKGCQEIPARAKKKWAARATLLQDNPNPANQRLLS